MDSIRKIMAAALTAGSLFLIQACNSSEQLEVHEEVAHSDHIIRTASFSSSSLYLSKNPKMKFIKTPEKTDEDTIAKQVVSERWKNDCFIPSSVTDFAF